MALKRILLGTTALLTAGGLAAATQAAEVKPIGALDINLGGFSRTYLFFGDLKDKNNGKNGAYDLRTDNEIYVYLRGKDEATGIEYGANVELETDTSSTFNTDEAFVFIKGQFGEFRLGDTDGVVEKSHLGAGNIAAFTGGIDGEGPFDIPAAVFGGSSDDSSKVIYYTPVFGGFQAGASWTPHFNSTGKNIGVTNDGGIDDDFEGTVNWTGQFGDFGVIVGTGGAWGHFNQDGPFSDHYYKIQPGIQVSFAGFKFAGAYGYTQGIRAVAAGDSATFTGGHAKPDDLPTYLGDVVQQRGSKSQFFNAGVATTIGPANVSLTYGQVFESQAPGLPGKDPTPYEAVLGADFAVAPGLVVGGEVEYFEGGIGTSNDNGVLALAGVRLAF